MEEFVSYTKIAALLGAAFTVAIGTMGPALAQGLVGSKACENVAKHPESSSKLFPILISSFAVIETSSLASVAIAFGLMYYAFVS